MIAGFISVLLTTLFGFVPGTTLSADGHTTSVSAMVSGVWWAGQLKGAPAAPPPSHVPPNGLWVSSTAAGTTAMSAVRFTISAGDRQPILSMPIDMLSPAQQSALAPVPLNFSPFIRACAATGNWSPPPAGTFGALSEAPAYDCTKGQTLAQMSDKAVVFNLSSFVSDTERVVSIVVIPGTSPAPIPSSPVALPIPALPPVLLSNTFDVTFKPLTPAAVAVRPSDAAPSDDVGFDETTSGATSDSTYSFVSPNSGTAFGTPSSPTVPARGFALLPRQVARQVGAVKVAAQRTERTIAAAVFLLLCMWAWSVANRSVVPGATAPGRPFRTLYDGDLTPGSVPVARQGFSRTPRSGRPPSLR